MSHTAMLLTLKNTGLKSPGTVALPAGSRISVSSRLPHTGGLFGNAQSGTLAHERIARIGTSRGPFSQGCLYAPKFTGRYTEYSSPCVGTFGMSCTRTDAVPRQVSNVPLLFRPAKNVTSPRLPRETV